MRRTRKRRKREREEREQREEREERQRLHGLECEAKRRRRGCPDECECDSCLDDLIM